MLSKSKPLLGLTIVLSALNGVTAYASVVPPGGQLTLGFEETQQSSGPVITGGATSCAALDASCAAVNFLSTPGSYFYGNGFNTQLSTPITGSPKSYVFYDDFIFNISPSTTDSITSTISLGSALNIQNLQVRLYNTSGNPTLPVLGTPNGGAIDAWSTTINGGTGMTGTVNVIPWTVLPAGTYVLEVAATGTGSSGGSYSGSLNLAPVPLPAALPLLISGLGLFGVGARRRQG